MADVPAGLSLRLALEYWDARSSIAFLPTGVASSNRSAFSLSWRVCFGAIFRPH